MLFAFLFVPIFSSEFLEPRENYPLMTTDILFQSGMYKSNNFRIPAIMALKDDSLVCATDIRYNGNGDLPARIGVMARRKTKGGIWSPAYLISGPVRDEGDGDAALVVDRKTGTLYCAFVGGNGFHESKPESPQHVYFTRSYDGGLTWEEKHDITHFLYSHLCTECSDTRKNKWTGMFVSSGTGVQLRDGRIAFACLVHDPTIRNYVLFSDDYGET